MNEERERTLARKRQVEKIFDQALDVAFEARSAFLEDVCEGDDELRREVEALLEVERAQTSSRLPAAGLAVASILADLHPSLQGLSLVPGMQVDRYELLRSLGQGGMGTVFLAHDRRLHRLVAIKFLHVTTREMTARFLAEARTTARCRHENIVVIHDVDEIDGRPYMVLEYLEGEPLRRRLVGLDTGETAAATPAARSREAGHVPPSMPVADALSLVIPVVRALVCAHEHGIVHRDLKPENVFLCSSGAVKVLDFGIAKALSDAGEEDIDAISTSAPTAAPRGGVVTKQGALIGTLPYMSPEQWGAGEIDERTDIWAVGIMLYEMLAGRHPLGTSSYSRMQKQILDLDLPMPGIDGAVPGLGTLAELVDACLRKRKAERIPSAEALLRALEAVRIGAPAGVVGAARDGLPTVSQAHVKPRRTASKTGREPVQAVPPGDAPRSRSLLLALAGAGIGLVALCLFALWPRLSIPAFHGTSGGVVLAVRAGAGAELRRAHGALCTALQALDAQAVRCVELSRFGMDHDELLGAGARAGASLVAALDPDGELHLWPVGAAAAILSELPAIHVAAADTQQQLPGILYPLSRALAGDLRFDELRAPPVSADAVGWRLATLAWYLNVLARNEQEIPPADLRSTMARCRQEVSLAEVACALAHYVHAQLDPTPPDARHWLEELLAHGPPAFGDLVIIELAEDDCMHEPERAHAALLRLASRWSDAPCRLVTLVGPAACLLTRYPAGAETLQPIAYPGEDVMAQCAADLVAAALSERGQWSMMAHDWVRAAEDFQGAWTRGSHPADLLNWAESLLHQRERRPDVAVQIAAALDLRYFEGEDELRHLAAFLRWLATHGDADAASMLQLYGDSPVHASVLVDDERTLASLVCKEPQHIECRVYEILARPRQPESAQELRRLLVAGDEH
jgi:serine/threonine protein kinase